MFFGPNSERQEEIFLLLFPMAMMFFSTIALFPFSIATRQMMTNIHQIELFAVRLEQYTHLVAYSNKSGFTKIQGCISMLSVI